MVEVILRVEATEEIRRDMSCRFPMRPFCVPLLLALA